MNLNSTSNSSINLFRRNVSTPSFQTPSFTNNSTLFPELKVVSVHNPNNLSQISPELKPTLSYSDMVNKHDTEQNEEKKIVVEQDEQKIYSNKAHAILLKMFERWDHFKEQYIIMFGEEEYDRKYGVQIDYSLLDFDSDDDNEDGEGEGEDEY